MKPIRSIRRLAAAVLAYRAWITPRKPVTAAPEPSAAGADILSAP